MSRRFNIIIGIVVGLILLVACFMLVDVNEIVEYLSKLNIYHVILFSLLYILAYFIRSFRWRLILKPIYKMKISESFLYFMAGMLLNYLIPIRAGEIAKSLFLKKNEDIKISKSLPSIFIDKLTDLFPIIIIIVLIPILSITIGKTLTWIIVAILIMYAIFMFILIFSMKSSENMHKVLVKLSFFFPYKYKIRLEDFYKSFIKGMGLLKGRRKDTIHVYFLTILAVLSESLFVFLVFRSLGINNIGFVKILFGYTLMNLTYILPTPPAQIGSNEFMWVVIFSLALGVNNNLTGAAVTIVHLLTTLIIVGIGTISFSAIGLKFGDVLKKNINDPK